jgi:hypothetical protein
MLDSERNFLKKAHLEDLEGDVRIRLSHTFRRITARISAR